MSGDIKRPAQQGSAAGRAKGLSSTPNATATGDPVQGLLDRLEGVRPAGKGRWSAKCPGHEDRRNSLSVARGDDGRCLIHCHAGCGTAAILDACGVSQAELFPANPNRNPRRRYDRPGVKNPPRRSRPDRARKPKPKPTHGPARRCETTPGEMTPEPLIRQLTTRMGQPSAVWEYLDYQWEVCGYVLRWDRPDGTKDIRPISRGPDDLWRIKAMPEGRPLYRLPFLRELAHKKTIFITEGEKAADALLSIGNEATTSSGGAKAATRTNWTPLAGRSVIIWPDNDPSGFTYADTVAEILTHLTPPATVRILPPAAFDMRDKEDAFDYVARRGGAV